MSETIYEDFITIEELCGILSIGKNTAYRLLKEQKIVAFRIGRTWNSAKSRMGLCSAKQQPKPAIKPFYISFSCFEHQTSALLIYKKENLQTLSSAGFFSSNHSVLIQDPLTF
ncbi:MAG: helix-turn-helix domain-containing protein [Lachnospiraceae bacterium]|nr:helix-turn-helix domain-containing protein [Lachnospiraceae bacterium]